MTDLLPASALDRAASLLRQGALVAFGTETVYGLGADATNPTAVAAIYQAKRRPSFNPLICHYACAADAFAHVIPNDTALLLAEKFWPGPLTLVLPRRPDCPVSELAGAGLSTLAVRIPAPQLTRDLIAAAGRPLAAPSANPSGKISPTTAAHVMEGLQGRIAAVLDCGPCAVGLESTVLDLSGDSPCLLRPGGVSREAIEALIGPILSTADHGAPKSPGQLLSHYAPNLPLRLDACQVAENEALLAFGPPLPGAAVLFNLSPTRDLTEAASRLFAGLHWLDREAAARGLQGLAAMPIPGAHLGAAIRDRLRRAAH
jgi:L-threonylcarbamoyladenylate synthase